MSRLLSSLLTAQQWRHHRAFEAATRRPGEAQAALLRRLLQDNRATDFGRAHGFADLTPAAYARRVPVRDYEALRPWMARAVAGEPDVLTAEPVLAFASTSGTTAEPKLVPVTESSARAAADLMRLWTACALRDHPGLLDGPVLTVVGPAREGTTPGGRPVGAMTGLTYQRLPWLVRRRHVLAPAVALIRDPETRYFVTARLALARSITALATPNPSTLLRLAEVADRRREALIRAIHDGSLGVEALEFSTASGAGQAELGAALRAGLTPDRPRAAALAAIVAARGGMELGDCWPRLALIGCWLGGATGLQARHLDTRLPGVPRRDLGLIASEGRLTVPMADGSPAGVLAVQTCFFEFIAEDEIDDPAPRTRLCQELEVGRRYYVIVSGPNGLYRYDLNDVVEVQGFHHATPRVAFVRKGRDMLSLTGEKLHLDQVLLAVRAAERATGLAVWQFRLVADAEQVRYDLLVEPVRPTASGPAAAFLAVFDRELAAANCEYAGKRASARLGPPRLRIMRAGWSERLCRQEFARGRRDVQHKWQAMRSGWDEASRTEIVESVGSEEPGERIR